MIGNVSTWKLLELIDARGPRFAVTGGVRADENRIAYTATAEDAERIRGEWTALNYRRVTVYDPTGTADLAALRQARDAAKDDYDERQSILRAGVLRALEAGGAEAAVAREAGVDRMTVRSWAGK